VVRVPVGGIRENNIGNGGKHKKKRGVKIKTQEQSYEILIYSERLT
jgi:hypothetical protein